MADGIYFLSRRVLANVFAVISLPAPLTRPNMSSSSGSLSLFGKTMSRLRSHTRTYRSMPTLNTKAPLLVTARQLTLAAWPLSRGIY